MKRDEYKMKLEDWMTEASKSVASDSLTGIKDTASVKVQIEPKDLAGGLVAYYPFMQNAKDASKNKNDGKLIDVTLAIDRYGNPDNAFRFNRNQFIEIKDSPSFKSIKTGVSAFAWINLSQYGGFRSGIVSQDGKWVLGVYRGVLVGKVYLDNGHSIYLESSQGVSLNHWNHVAMTFNGQTLALYINGRKVATKPAPGRYQIKRPKNFRLYGQPSIGRAFGVGGKSFIGSIDDVFIYNRVLNETELAAIFNGELPEL
ncbi:MAG: LamG domain-containing protein [FCB group bacterium]|nr:LamG domain-containing protein [FCB group bacterium]